MNFWRHRRSKRSPNQRLCLSALRWSGFGRQLYRNRVSRRTWTLLWRRAPLHSQLGQKVRSGTSSPSLHTWTCSFSFESIYKFSARVCLSFRKSLTLKYYAKKILYFLRQQNILRSLKVFLERPPEQQSALEGQNCIALVWFRHKNRRRRVSGPYLGLVLGLYRGGVYNHRLGEKKLLF